jgi:NAD+ diphosphatase
MDHFPRTDPVVIMLVVDGDRCLLGHEKRFGQMYSRKFYSTLAGFLESGEDIEAAVRREVLEEAGIKVGKVHYYRSQPWPFPHSLMMGCIAEAASKEINIDKHEIEDAKWFSREEARAALAGEHPELAVPGKHAIAHHLIKAFVEDSWRNS